MSIKVKQLRDDVLVIELEGYFGEMGIKEKHEIELAIVKQRRIK